MNNDLCSFSKGTWTLLQILVVGHCGAAVTLRLSVYSHWWVAHWCSCIVFQFPAQVQFKIQAMSWKVQVFGKGRHVLWKVHCGLHAFLICSICKMPLSSIQLHNPPLPYLKWFCRAWTLHLFHDPFCFAESDFTTLSCFKIRLWRPVTIFWGGEEALFSSTCSLIPKLAQLDIKAVTSVPVSCWRMLDQNTPLVRF